MRHDDPMAWDGTPSEEELHAEYLDWLWRHALPEERASIQCERIAAARRRGDPRCPECGGRRRSHCLVCAGAGYLEPGLRPTTPTEDVIANRTAVAVSAEDW